MYRDLIKVFMGSLDVVYCRVFTSLLRNVSLHLIMYRFIALCTFYILCLQTAMRYVSPVMLSRIDINIRFCLKNDLPDPKRNLRKR